MRWFKGLSLGYCAPIVVRNLHIDKINKRNQYLIVNTGSSVGGSSFFYNSQNINLNANVTSFTLSGADDDISLGGAEDTGCS